MKIVIKNSKIVFAGTKPLENLIKPQECVNKKYLEIDGTIKEATDARYYVSNKIPFTDDISVNTCVWINGTTMSSFATALVFKNSDNSFVRAIQVMKADNQAMPQINRVASSDADTYVILCARIKDEYTIEDWGAYYGSRIEGKFLY